MKKSDKERLIAAGYSVYSVGQGVVKVAAVIASGGKYKPGFGGSVVTSYRNAQKKAEEHRMRADELEKIENSTMNQPSYTPRMNTASVSYNQITGNTTKNKTTSNKTKSNALFWNQIHEQSINEKITALFSIYLRFESGKVLENPKAIYSTSFAVNGRSYNGIKTLDAKRLKDTAFKNNSVSLFTDTYSSEVLLIKNGQHQLRLFHNGTKISAVYCKMSNGEISEFELYKNLTMAESNFYYDYLKNRFPVAGIRLKR